MLGERNLTQVDRTSLLRAHYAFQHGCFISETAEFSGGLVAHSKVTPVPMWNHAAWLGGPADQFESFLSTATAEQSRNNRRPVIYLPEPGASDVLALERAGYRKFDEEAWMSLREPRNVQLSSRAVEVANQTQLEKFITAFTAAFSIKEEGYGEVLRQVGKDSELRARHFILLQDGRAVSVGTLISKGSFACIYNVGTPPAERKKGFGGELFQHIARTAQESGCTTIFLQVENNSSAKRLYEKFGFATEFIRAGFRLDGWTPRQEGGHTKLSSLLGNRGVIRDAAQSGRETKALSVRLAERLSNLGFRQCSIAAWAYVLHRYTGEQSIALLVHGLETNSPRAISLPIPREQKVQSWIRSIQTKTESAADGTAEVALHFHEKSASHFERPELPIEVHLCGNAPDKCEILFRSDLFSKDAIRRMAGHFTTVLESIADRPAGLVRDLELLSPAEKHQLLVEWNETDFERTDERISQLFEAQVERTPDAIALVLAGPESAGEPEQMSYRQFNRKANRLAHRLQELGVGPDVYVGVFLDRSLDMIVALFAILKAGGACVPLDPAYPRPRIEFMVQDSNAAVILTQKHLAGTIPDVKHAKIVLVDEPIHDRRPDSEKNPVASGSPADAAYLIYTSGSTGKPKGVVITQEAIANHSLDCRKHYGLSSRDRVLQFSSFNFDAAFEQIFPALISGARLIVRGSEIWSTREFAARLKEHQLTVADIPVAYWHQLADEWSADPSLIPPNALRLVIVGGEAPSPHKLARWQSTPMKKVRLINAYGPTETTITATSFEAPARHEADSESVVLPIGKPRGDRKAYVLDAFGSPTPIGVPGELHIGGSLLARGYHKRPELTASRFIPNPFSDDPDARLYKTGDLVRHLEDGNLEFLGRLDDQVKIRGFRVELGEIESCLSKHPSVRGVLVIARPDGSSGKKLVAYMVSKGERPNARELRGFIKSRLPEYMIPSSFVVLEKWPLLPSGKVDRRALPDPEEETDMPAVNGPRDSLELQIQLLFERVLKRAPIDIRVSFFELGGDSLQALELLVEVEKATGKQLPLGTLYQSSTIEALAREVQSRSTPRAWSSLVPLQTSGKRAPLFLLHTTPGDILGYGNLVYRIGAEQPCYGFQSLGLKEASLSHQTVEEMARYYVNLLRVEFPQGPYYLGGWCYGGIVAVEMARLLRAQGEEIGLLALLETVAMPPGLSNHKYHLHRLRCLLRLSPARWITYVREKARYTRESRVANRMRFRQVDSSGSATGEILDPRLAKLEQVYNTNLKALTKYRSTYYDGKVTLFNAAEKDPALIPDPQYGWIGLAREIEIREVPGNHDTMLFEPNVSVLAQELNSALQAAQQSYENKPR